MDLFPRAQPVDIRSEAAPATVLERLRALVSGWPRSALAPAGRAAGIYGWILDERDPPSFVLRPRPLRGGAPLVTFEGNVEPTSPGSRICGRIRLHTITRIFLAVVVLFAAGAPLGALFEKVPPEDWHHHVLRARNMLAIGVSIAIAAVLMVRFGVHLLGRHIRALLAAAAQAASDRATRT